MTDNVQWRAVFVRKLGKIEKTRAPKPKPARASNAKDVARVEALQAELSALEARMASERGEVEARLAALERERSALAKRHEKALDAVQARLKATRAKLRP